MSIPPFVLRIRAARLADARKGAHELISGGLQNGRPRSLVQGGLSDERGWMGPIYDEAVS